MAQFGSALKVLFLAFFVVLLSSCGQKKAANSLTVGVSAEYPPFEFKENNKLAGFDIELAELLAKKLNRPVELVNMDFSALIPAVQSGRIDMAISSVSATPERSQAVDFSIPYHESRFAFVSQSKSPVKNLDDMAGHSIGVQMGSTMEQFARTKIDSRLKVKIITMNSNLPLIEELKIGRVAAVIVEDAQAYQFVKNNTGLVYELSAPTGTGYAIALKKNAALTHEINAALEALKREGILKRLEQQWLEMNEK